MHSSDSGTAPGRAPVDPLSPPARDHAASEASLPGSTADIGDTIVDLRGAYEAAGIQEVLNQLDRDLVGLRPVKARIREIAALLVVNRARRQVEIGRAHV